jgi:phosphatidyl-myo-inositol alpha-mannosyltransferase
MVSDHCPEHPQVRVIAFPDDATLAQLYRSAWVFAYPSCYEGFGMPYVEALASGTPIVTSPNSGAASILQQGQYGNIVDDDAFASAIIMLLSDASLRDHQSQSGLQRSRDFSWHTITQEYLATYETAIDRFSPSASRCLSKASQRQS